MLNKKLIEKYDYDTLTPFSKALIKAIKLKRNKGFAKVKLRNGHECEVGMVEHGFYDSLPYSYKQWFWDGTCVGNSEHDIVELLLS